MLIASPAAEAVPLCGQIWLLYGLRPANPLEREPSRGHLDPSVQATGRILLGMDKDLRCQAS